MIFGTGFRQIQEHMASAQRDWQPYNLIYLAETLPWKRDQSNHHHHHYYHNGHTSTTTTSFTNHATWKTTQI